MIVDFTNYLFLGSLRSLGKLSLTELISYNYSNSTGITSISPASSYYALYAASFFRLGLICNITSSTINYSYY